MFVLWSKVTFTRKDFSLETCVVPLNPSYLSFPMLEKGRRSVTAARAAARIIARLLLAAVFVCAFIWTLPASVHAQTATPPDATAPLNDAAAAAGVDGSVSLVTLIGRIINVVFGFLGVVLLGYILYAGFLWMTAQGDTKRVQLARDTIRNAIIGLLIFASSFAIANFIIRQLGGISSGDGFFGGQGSSDIGLSGFPDRSGALGDVVRDVYPMPGSRNVPRNTAIMVTFSQPIKIDSFVRGYNDNRTPENLDDDVATSTTIGLNTDNIRIYRTSEGRTRALTTDQVRVRFTPDRLTFVMRPVAYLGSSAEPQDYTVELAGGSSGVKLENGQPVFSGRSSAGYRWVFQVSTNVDLTPPKIVSAIPASGGRYAPNIVVQVNFDEAMDPTSAAGVVREGGAGFNNIEVTGRPLAGGATGHPAGEFKISNAYTTVEFVTNLACGVNSCGRQIFCLPSDSAIQATVKAASLESPGSPQAAIVRGLYDGLVDAASNSLDGNGNGIAEGPTAGRTVTSTSDTYKYSFSTLTNPDRTPPFIRGFTPTPETGLVPVDQIPTADFNGLLQSSTVNSENIKLLTNEPLSDTFWFRPRMQNLIGGRPALLGENASSSRVLIDRRVYAAATTRFSPEYYPSFGSGVQNIYQNCFNPTGSDNTTRECHGTVDRPNCCFVGGVATPSASACPYPTTSRP
jgi:hypothetical protein